MMLASMKSYPVLFLGLSVLFSMESESVSISDISDYTSTSHLMTTTERAHNLTTALRHHKETEQQPTVDSINSTVVTQTPLRRPAEVTAAATAGANVSRTASSEEAVSTTQTHNYTGTTAGVVAMSPSNNTSSSRPPLSHISTATSADTARPSHSVNISKTEKPTDRQQQSAVTSAATAAATSEREVVSTSNLSSTTPDRSTPASFSVQEPISTTVSPTSVSSTATSLISTLEPSHVFDHSTTSLSDNETETSSTSADPPPTSQPTSTTETLMSSTGQRSPTVSPTTSEVITTISNISTTSISTSQSTAVLITRVPKRLPIMTTAPPTTTTAAPCGTSKTPSSTGVQSCTSSRGVVTHCLIAIAALAGLATIFMVSTIVLCTKLSSRKYRVKSPQQGTEMMCISSLLPERNYTYARQRNPVSNGVLLIPSGGDSDEDGGDNVTLSSFLPDNDRFV